MSEAPWMAVRRARAAAAPRPARPRPPAKRGLLKSASRGRKDVDSGGLDIVLEWNFFEVEVHDDAEPKSPTRFQISLSINIILHPF